MDKNELETYQVQLSQVEVALAADPSNEGLASLRSELKELIDLTKAAIAQAEAPRPEPTRKASATSAAAAPGFAAGDEILAKYSGDGSFYPARVTSVGGSADNRVYSVVFKGYNNTELLTAAALKPLPASYANHAALSSSSSSSKRKLSKEEEDEREKKKKKNEKKVETRAAKAKEQTSKQATWQKFTKKAEKKGVTIAGVSGTSIFKTPDNPHGRGTWRS
jgi:survival-of-motor-neuron-related-splicing factor 30